MANMMKKSLILFMLLFFVTGMTALPVLAEELDALPASEDAAETQTDTAEETAEEPAKMNFSPVLRVETTADKTVYETGETVTWSITVRNVSTYMAHDVVITDDMTQDVWMIGVLYPGAALSFSAVTENVQAGTLWNTAVASWSDGDEIPDGEETDEIKCTAGQVSVTVQDPIPPATSDTPGGSVTPAVPGGEIDIFDEDVPLADVPRTGDISAVWLTLSAMASGGMLVLGKKRPEDA